MIPYPTWLGSGDNAWQMTAATLVGLMSIPALAVLYGGLVQKKWAMNTVLMVFSTFCLVLITWVLWAYKMGFGTPLISTFVGDPRSILGANAMQRFWRITLPSIKWGIVYGVVLTLARSLGEFGAVKVVSGNVLGQTRTATLAVEEKYLNFDQQGAYATAFLLAMVSVACIVIVGIIRPKNNH